MKEWIRKWLGLNWKKESLDIIEAEDGVLYIFGESSIEVYIPKNTDINPPFERVPNRFKKIKRVIYGKENKATCGGCSCI